MLRRYRRLVRRAVERVNGFTGMVETVVLPVQTSSAYAFSVAAVKPTGADPQPIKREFRGPGEARQLELMTGLSFRSRVQVKRSRDPSSEVEA